MRVASVGRLFSQMIFNVVPELVRWSSTCTKEVYFYNVLDFAVWCPQEKVCWRERSSHACHLPHLGNLLFYGAEKKTPFGNVTDRSSSATLEVSASLYPVWKQQRTSINLYTINWVWLWDTVHQKIESGFITEKFSLSSDQNPRL